MKMEASYKIYFYLNLVAVPRMINYKPSSNHGFVVLELI
jgi:hypothetical protein